MKNIYIYYNPKDKSYTKIFKDMGFEVFSILPSFEYEKENLKKIFNPEEDLIVFSSSGDNLVYITSEERPFELITKREENELRFSKKIIENKIPFLGIGRGALIVSLANRGKIIFSNSSRSGIGQRFIKDKIGKREILVNVYTQSILGSGNSSNHEDWAVSEENKSIIQFENSEGKLDRDYAKKSLKEVVYYPDNLSLAFCPVLGHNSVPGYSTQNYLKYCLNLFEEKINESNK